MVIFRLDNLSFLSVIYSFNWNQLENSNFPSRKPRYCFNFCINEVMRMIPKSNVQCLVVDLYNVTQWEKEVWRLAIAVVGSRWKVCSTTRHFSWWELCPVERRLRVPTSAGDNTNFLWLWSTSFSTGKMLGAQSPRTWKLFIKNRVSAAKLFVYI